MPMITRLMMLFMLLTVVACNKQVIPDEAPTSETTTERKTYRASYQSQSKATCTLSVNIIGEGSFETPEDAKKAAEYFNKKFPKEDKAYAIFRIWYENGDGEEVDVYQKTESVSCTPK